MKHTPSFGTALRSLRRAKGISQEGFGINQTNVSKLELGKKIPSWDRVGQIADHLGVHPLTLFTLSYLNESAELGVEELLTLVRSEIQEVKCSEHAEIPTKSNLV
ncbi:helix-turn-helix domain-containing protein [Pseudomonas monteilii]|uniref:helix-turn-helix domain-containing protein n=1 Tax=Pseudomonas monteilii TaxID=76759 RepID=UPI0015FD3F75|nr:helix-turn-helix transcriptional regulator [Pseudomonas monteilii]MBA6105905.1 helix-turn-helix transcriptional regulator [Pseudomonas monteilii]